MPHRLLTLRFVLFFGMLLVALSACGAAEPTLMPVARVVDSEPTATSSPRPSATFTPTRGSSMLRVFTKQELIDSIAAGGFHIEEQWSPSGGKKRSLKAVFIVARKIG